MVDGVRRPPAADSDAVLIRLRHHSRRRWVAGLGLLSAAAVLLAPLWTWASALRWAGQAAVVWIWVLIRLEILLNLNRRPVDNRLRPSLGAATTLTLGRGALVAALAGFLFQDFFRHLPTGPLSWIPGVFYLTAVLMDAVDGWVARRTSSETRLGAALDMEIDALGILIASALLVISGKAPLIFASVGLGYYVVRGACRLRSWMGFTVGQVQPRPHARLVAGCLMGVSASALLPIFEREATLPVTWMMTATFLSGMATDWLVICGRAGPNGRLFHPRLATWQAAGGRALPVFLRIALTIGIGLLMSAPCYVNGTALTTGILCLGLMCGLGVAARLAGMILSFVLADLISAGCQSSGAPFAVAAAVALIMTGAGRPRIWQPEDPFFLKKHN